MHQAWQQIDAIADRETDAARVGVAVRAWGEAAGHDRVRCRDGPPGNQVIGEQ